MNIINRNKSLSVYPEIVEIDYSSKIDSSDLNKMIKSLQESSLRAILRSRDVTSELQRLQTGLITSYIALAGKYDKLEYKAGDYAFATAYDLIDNPTTVGKILYDRDYGLITLNPIGSYSKIPRGEKYNGRVSPLVIMTLDDTLIEQNSVAYDALDGTRRSFWLEEVDPGERITDRLTTFT